MGFSRGFHKTAVVGALLGAAGRMVGRGVLGAGAATGKAAAKTFGMASRVAGGPLNLAFTTLDAGNQFNRNMDSLKSVYRG